MSDERHDKLLQNLQRLTGSLDDEMKTLEECRLELLVLEHDLRKFESILATHRRAADKCRVLAWAETGSRDEREFQRFAAEYHDEKVISWGYNVERVREAVREQREICQELCSE